MKKALIIVLCFCFLFGLTAFGEEKSLMLTNEFYSKIVAAECAYIRSLVLPNGAVGFDLPSVGAFEASSLPTVDGVAPETYTKWKTTTIIPYFSAFAVLGYMEADGKDAEKLTKDYIDWYISHMNEKDVNGIPDTVYDYRVFVSDDGQVIEVSYPEFYGDNSNNYDSTDSYASTFLQILCKYTEKYDKDFLKNNVELVERLVNVIYSTYCEDVGLTGAKPDYMVCYLMDNCEVYAAFDDLSAHFPEYAKDAESFRRAIIESLGKEEFFLAAVFENGKDAYNMTNPEEFEFYPHGTCQLFPITFGILSPDSEQAKAQYKLFNDLFGLYGTEGKDWTTVNCGDSYPWGLNLRAAVKMGDYERAERFIKTVYGKYISAGHTGSYYCAEAGHLLLAISELKYDETEVSSAESGEISAPLQESGSFSKLLPFIIGGAVILGAAAVTAAVLLRKKR